ncbi:MAG: HIT domain-containing protein [Desulfuromonadaceae bacterium]|nr:HIT domain-containing protein [Desulfuromonadaceae bacterium]
MEQLWAPWRMDYVGKDSDSDECIFCIKGIPDQDRQRLVLFRGRHGFIMMNRYPYSNGHLMIVPFRHTSEIEDLSSAEQLELFDLLIRARRVLNLHLRPQGFNIGINLGKVGGAGVTEHVHLHIVPRWLGDTNFMPVFADVRVIPQHLETTYDMLRKTFEEPDGGC